jgi:hypothetical protein
MANRILTATGWEKRIQDKMGVDPAYLPDSVVQQPDHIAVAEANIIAQIPGYATVTGDAKVYLEAAVVCECAVLLCPGMPARLPRQSQGPHARYELDTDWDKKKAELAAERDGHVNRVLEIAFPSSAPAFRSSFAVTTPTRAWETDE